MLKQIHPLGFMEDRGFLNNVSKEPMSEKYEWKLIECETRDLTTAPRPRQFIQGRSLVYNDPLKEYIKN